MFTAIFNDHSFNMLTNHIVSFEQLDPAVSCIFQHFLSYTEMMQG